MEQIEKLGVLLQHWIDHNRGHVEEFTKWRDVAAQEGKEGVAKAIEEAMNQMGRVNDHLGKALEEVGGAATETGHHHHHDHDHHHH